MNGCPPRLSSEELHLLNELLSSRFGLHFSEWKREILESRLAPRIRALGMARFMDYYLLLQFGLNGDQIQEIDRLVGAITNNETYFFRETHQLDALFEHGIGSVTTNSPPGGELRILCAGCSSGEEAYTLNIYANENQFRLGGQGVRIDAFDIDVSKIRNARRAEYGRNSVRALTENQILRYFQRPEPDRFILREPHRSGVQFHTGNIVDPSRTIIWQTYDVIFCRNVLIYFSEEGLRRAIENFSKWLRPGGLLFLGHSESIMGRSDRFEVARIGRCIAYRKVNAAALPQRSTEGEVRG